MYRCFSHGELVGHTGPELRGPRDMPPGTPRLYVFVPGPAFSRVWPALEALQRATADTMRTLIAAHDAGRLPPLHPGASPEEIRAHYAGVLPSGGTELSDVRALALELHDANGPLKHAGVVSVTEHPADVFGVMTTAVHEEMMRSAPGLGFQGDPPYYTLAVPPEPG